MDKLSLQEILKATNAEANSDKNILFNGVTTDSRKVTDGVLFVETIHFDDKEVAHEAIGGRING